MTLAIEQRTTRLLHRLTADPPAWLHPWLGPRPTDPTGATVWDDEIRHLATWRDTHHTPAHVPGYGPPPDDPNLHDQWTRHVARSNHNRTWLHQHTPQLTAQPVIPLDPDEIRTRLAELDEILATAPPDQRRIIHALHTGSLQPADLQHALTAAHTTQRDRRAWIIEHWPHVVEHAELTLLANTPTPTAAVGTAAQNHDTDPVTTPPVAAPAPPPPTARPTGPTLDLI